MIRPAALSDVASFYAGHGYRLDGVLFMEKWLVPEPGPSFIPNEPGRSPTVPSPGAGGWRDIQPDLAAEPYVFAGADQSA